MAEVFWAALILLGFTYLGYPTLMAAKALLRPRPVHSGACTPQVDVLLVVHDAAHWLEPKLANLLALDYPPEKLLIHVVCDGCTDATEAIARRHVGPRVRVLAFAQRRGKSACIGLALPLLEGDIVVFTDVRQTIDPGAVHALTAALWDARVGVASGELMLNTSDGYGAGISAYWRYEKWLRRLESASGSLVGATGALYAIRRSVAPTVPPGLILDDMWIPLAIADAGYRVVCVEQAVAYDRSAGDPATEEVRKRRTLSGNFQLLHRWPRLALPGGHPLAWRLWGHKWLRLLAPWLLLAVLLSNLVLAGGSAFYTVLLAVQVLGYGLGVAARIFPVTVGYWLPARLATAFCSLNLSALLAFFDYVRNPQAHLWQIAPYRQESR